MCHVDNLKVAKKVLPLPGSYTYIVLELQTWMSRYKKVVCSMPKVHHHFYLHRMVKRRNAYISYCYKHGRRPIHAKKSIS